MTVRKRNVAKKKASKKGAKTTDLKPKVKPWKPDERQMRFMEYFDECGVGSIAAIRAGYGERGAAAHASRLLTNVNIKAELARRSKARGDRLSFTADTVLQELASLACVTIEEFLDPETGELVGNFKDIPSYALGAVRSVETTRGIDGLGRDVTTTKFKLHDRHKALVDAGKHKDVQAFLEKIAVEGDMAAEMRRAMRQGEDLE